MITEGFSTHLSDQHRLGRANRRSINGHVRLVGDKRHDAGPLNPVQDGIRGLDAREVRLLLRPGPMPRTDQIAAKVRAHHPCSTHPNASTDQRFSTAARNSSTPLRGRLTR